MKVTLTAIKADIGSIGGHICPSEKLLAAVENTVKEDGRGFSGAAMLGIHDLEYVGINHRLDALESRFVVRNSEE